jgi:hypothetical protein
VTVKKKEFGVCVICNEYGELSYEHIPPKGAFNNNPIKIKKHENIFETESYIYQKSSKLNKGYGKYCLCSNCNNFFGGAYCNDYINVVKQIYNYFEKNIRSDSFNDIPLKIKPLNVIKQIIAIYICLNSGDIDENEKKILTKFLLDKENKYLPETYSIYLYNTFKTLPRWLGNVTYYQNGSFLNISELVFSPLGLQICNNSFPSDLSMVNITDFKKFNYNQEVDLIFRLPIIEKNNPLYNGD